MARQYPVREKPLTLSSPLGTLQAMRGGLKTAPAARTARATRIDLLQTFALRSSASSRGRIGTFARLTSAVAVVAMVVAPVEGSAGAGPARPPSIVGIAKEYVDAGAVARGVREDRASIHRVKI